MSSRAAAATASIRVPRARPHTRARPARAPARRRTRRACSRPCSRTRRRAIRRRSASRSSSDWARRWRSWRCGSARFAPRSRPCYRCVRLDPGGAGVRCFRPSVAWVDRGGEWGGGWGVDETRARGSRGERVGRPRARARGRVGGWTRARGRAFDRVIWCVTRGAGARTDEAFGTRET